MKKYKLVCDVCGHNYENSNKFSRGCSLGCRRVRLNKRYGIEGSGLPTQFLGRLNEYLVACDLGKRGWDVYFSMFPQQHYDLVIRHRDSGKLLIVEVKTGYKSPETGRAVYPKHRHSEWDIMAVVIKDIGIDYLDKNKNLINLSE